MNEPTFASRLTAWLDEGPDAAPPDLIDLVLEELPGIGPGGRAARWHRPARLGSPGLVRQLMAACVVAVIAVVATLTLLPGRTQLMGIQTRPSPTATAWPSPTATPGPSPRPTLPVLPTPKEPIVRVIPSPQGTVFFDPCVPSEDPAMRTGYGFDPGAVRGWIAYGDGTRILAVNPTSPDDKVVLKSAIDADPTSWSRDGNRLLVVGDEEGSRFGDRSPIVLGSDGSGTRVSKGGIGAFSPDGSMVVFAVPGGGLCYASPDGNYREFLAFDMSEPFDEFPAWSPDGSEIAFLDFVEDSPRYGHHAYGLSFINVDGSDLRQLAVALPGEEGHGGLSWSPDGTRLVFWHTISGRPQIFVVNADGTALRQITTEGRNTWPAWSPDGSRIAFVHDGTLSTMTSDGADVRVLAGILVKGSIAWNAAR
jgi:WD40-like Beta Propeller Repeat